MSNAPNPQLLKQQLENARRMERRNIAVTLLAGWGCPLPQGLEFNREANQAVVDHAFDMAELIIKTGNTRP